MAPFLGVLVSFCPFSPDTPLITYEESYFRPAVVVSYFLPFKYGPMKMKFKKNCYEIFDTRNGVKIKKLLALQAVLSFLAEKKSVYLDMST